MSRSFRIGTTIDVTNEPSLLDTKLSSSFIILMLNHRPLARSLLWGGYDGDGSKVVEVVSSSAMPVFVLSSVALVVVSFILLSKFSRSLGLIAQHLVNRWGMKGEFSSSSSSSSSSMTTCVEKRKKKG